MIPFKVYRSLSAEKQAHILWEDGIFLDLARQTPKLHIELYALHDFYVELFFDRKTEEPLYLKSFRNLKGLDPYLSQVSIENLLEIRK
jgi:hypothetical protein